METSQLQEVLRGCQRKDRVAQRELYRAFYRHGLSVCLRYINDLETAQELVNDSFLKVFANIGKYKPEYPFAPWFSKIVANTAINHIRAHIHDIETESFDLGTEVAVEEQLFQQLNSEDIVALIQKLSPAYRLVFNLYAIEGYEHKEIAKLLGIAIGTSMSNLAKARKKMQELVQQMNLIITRNEK
jgi:RNA polymerase sigma-70 factor (ECF subfamily)